MKNALLALFFAGVLLCLGPLLDGPSEHQAAQDIAAEVLALAPAIPASADPFGARIERAAARACLEALGIGASHAWTQDNQLVCTPPQPTQKGNL